MCFEGQGNRRQALWQRLNAAALLLLILPKFVFAMEPWRLVFEAAGAVCLGVAIWMMFRDRRRV